MWRRLVAPNFKYDYSTSVSAFQRFSSYSQLRNDRRVRRRENTNSGVQISITPAQAGSCQHRNIWFCGRSVTPMRRRLCLSQTFSSRDMWNAISLHSLIMLATHVHIKTTVTSPGPLDGKTSTFQAMVAVKRPSWGPLWGWSFLRSMEFESVKKKICRQTAIQSKQ